MVKCDELEVLNLEPLDDTSNGQQLKAPTPVEELFFFFFFLQAPLEAPSKQRIVNCDGPRRRSGTNSHGEMATTGG